MWQIEPLKEGQDVFLKRPLQIYAKVIGPLKSDSGLPQEQVRYAVQLTPLEQYYLLEDLEPAQYQQPMKSQSDYFSPERVDDSGEFKEATSDNPTGDPFFGLAQEINNLIARRAYELFERRGFAHGYDAEDWLRAESEILFNFHVDISETDAQLTVHAQMPEFNEHDLEVRAAPRSVCIAGKPEKISERTEGVSAFSDRRARRIFRVLDLPSEIDPAKAVASVNNGTLEIKLPKAGLPKVILVRAKAATA